MIFPNQSLLHTYFNAPRAEMLAEFLGTFFLVLFGCGAIVVNEQFAVIGHGGIAAAFGLIVMIMIYSVGNISGAHLNPAVTLAFSHARGFPKAKILPFILAQLSGALTAAWLLKLGFPENESLGSTATHVGLVAGFVCEFILSFMLMFVILNVTTGHQEKGIMAGVAIGATVAIEALVAGPLTNASMNPARSIGPALASGELDDLWLFIAAPTLGMLAAAPFCSWVQGAQCCESR